MSKNTYRINESQLRGLIAESIKKVLNEGWTAEETAREYEIEYDNAKKKVFDSCEVIGAEEFFQIVGGITSEGKLLQGIAEYCWDVMRDCVVSNKEDGTVCYWHASNEDSNGILWGACGNTEVFNYHVQKGDYFTEPRIDYDLGDTDLTEAWVSYEGKVANIADLLIDYIQ